MKLVFRSSSIFLETEGRSSPGLSPIFSSCPLSPSVFSLSPFRIFSWRAQGVLRVFFGKTYEVLSGRDLRDIQSTDSPCGIQTDRHFHLHCLRLLFVPALHGPGGRGPRYFQAEEKLSLLTSIAFSLFIVTLIAALVIISSPPPRRCRCCRPFWRSSRRSKSAMLPAFS